jgi:hypothetical protein
MNELGPSFSLSPGASVTQELWWPPGWGGYILWVPHPQQVGTCTYSSPYVALEGDGTFHFGQTVTNVSGATIDCDIEYTSL